MAATKVSCTSIAASEAISTPPVAGATALSPGLIETTLPSTNDWTSAAPSMTPTDVAPSAAILIRSFVPRTPIVDDGVTILIPFLFMDPET